MWGVASPTGVTALCRKPVSRSEMSSATSRMLNALDGRVPPSAFCCLCSARLSLSALSLVAYCVSQQAHR